jgi:hypothetical protein
MVCGMYELVTAARNDEGEGGGGAADGAAEDGAVRAGRLDIYTVAASASAPTGDGDGGDDGGGDGSVDSDGDGGGNGSGYQLADVQSVELSSGVLDSKWSPRELGGKAVLGAVTADGRLELFELGGGCGDGSEPLQLHASCSAGVGRWDKGKAAEGVPEGEGEGEGQGEGGDQVIYLSLDWDNAGPAPGTGPQPRISVGQSDGAVSLWEVDSTGTAGSAGSAVGGGEEGLGLRRLEQWQAHDLCGEAIEVWCASFDRFQVGDRMRVCIYSHILTPHPARTRVHARTRHARTRAYACVRAYRNRQFTGRLRPPPPHPPLLLPFPTRAQPALIYSGGDDTVLRVWDTRTPLSGGAAGGGGAATAAMGEPTGSRRPVAVCRAHSAGVCTAVCHPTRDGVLVTGSYDGKVRLWDKRQWRAPVHEYDTGPGGGVWRLKWHPTRPELLLAAAMRAQVQVMRLEEGRAGEAGVTSRQLLPVLRYAGHPTEALAYGIDWCDGGSGGRSAVGGGVVGSCSFYDKNVQLWQCPRALWE